MLEVALLQCFVLALQGILALQVPLSPGLGLRGVVQLRVQPDVFAFCLFLRSPVRQANSAVAERCLCRVRLASPVLEAAMASHLLRVVWAKQHLHVVALAV